MNRILFVLSICLSFVAHAEDEKIYLPAEQLDLLVGFVHDSPESYYSCYYIEREMESLLHTLGATEIFVDCRGGLPDFVPNVVQVKFKSIRETKDSNKATRLGVLTPTELHFTDSCDLRGEMLDLVMPYFSAYNLEINEFCWGPRGRIDYKMDLLK